MKVFPLLLGEGQGEGLAKEEALSSFPGHS